MKMKDISFVIASISLTCVVGLTAFASPLTRPSSEPVCQSRCIPVHYAEETELVAVVCHLAGISGYVFSEEDGVLPDYLADVDSTFAAFKGHRAVKFAGSKLFRKGFAWDMPMAFALRLRLNDGRIEYNHGLEADFEDYYYRISRGDEKKFIAMLVDFYRDSAFGDFFKSHSSLYGECEAAMRKVVDNLDVAWYDSFFGPNDGGEFRIYLGLLNGPGNYAVHQRLLGGGEVVNAVMGCCDRDSSGRIYYGETYTLPVLIHEFNHSYCNPLNEECWASIEAQANAIFRRDPSFYASIAYGSPQLVMNETFVEASMIRYLMSHSIDIAGTGFGNMQELIDTLIDIDERKKKFVLIRPVIEALGRRESSSGQYPTMRDFLPEYVSAVNAYTPEDQ
ncbi:MAG: DUF4932 domain-containing protein [Candidatus Cryptobacteroides sp.]